MKAMGVVIFVFFFSLPSMSAIENKSPFEYKSFNNFLPTKKKLDDLNRRKKYPLGFNLYGFGPVGLASLSIDYFITPKLALETGAGFRDFDGNIAFTIGGRYHLLGKTFLSLTPYVGLYTAFHYNGSSLQNNAIYIPVGIHKIKKNKFSWSAEVAYQRNTFFGNGITGGFRLGYRF